MTDLVNSALLAALAKALPKLEGAKKNKANPAFKSKYADLAAVIDAIEPIAECGLWYRQVSHERPDGVAVETFYIHEAGELSAGTFFVPADKKNAQGYGSANSYARRYGLQLAFGLATEDDDGNAAVKAVPTSPHTGEPTGRTQGWREPDSTLSTPSKLAAEMRRLERELAGCGDADMVYGLTASDEWREFARVALKHAPHYLRGGDPAPPEFEGLANTAERLVREFEAQKEAA